MNFRDLSLFKNLNYNEESVCNFYSSSKRMNSNTTNFFLNEQNFIKAVICILFSIINNYANLQAESVNYKISQKDKLRNACNSWNIIFSQVHIL